MFNRRNIIIAAVVAVAGILLLLLLGEEAPMTNRASRSRKGRPMPNPSRKPRRRSYSSKPWPTKRMESFPRHSKSCG